MLLPSRLTSTSCERIFRLLHKNWQRCDISVSVVISVPVMWFKVRVPAGAVDFGLLQNAQAVSGAQPASYFVGTGSSFPLCKVDRQAEKLTTDLHLVLSLSVTGATPLLLYLYLCIRTEQHRWDIPPC